MFIEILKGLGTTLKHSFQPRITLQYPEEKRMPRPRDEIRRISALKLSNDESFYRVADRALQVHGGLGVMRDTSVNKLFQIARNLRIPGGTDEVQRTTIAESLGLRFDVSKTADLPTR